MLCSEENPHCRRIKQQICSGHHNSSLGILSRRYYRLYPIPVCPSLILLHKLLHNTSLLSLYCHHQPAVVDNNSSLNMLSLNTRLHTARASCTTLSTLTSVWAHHFSPLSSTARVSTLSVFTSF